MSWFKRKEAGPPSAASVAKRALVLRHVAVYALMTPPSDLFAATYESWSEKDRAEYQREADIRRDEYWSRLKTYALDGELSPWERSFAQATMATMTSRQQVDASWCVEAIQVLMWALGLMPSLPPYHESADHDILKEFPPSEPPAFIKTAELRPREEINEGRDRAELWHWRSRTRQLQASGDRLTVTGELLKIGVSSYDDIVRMTARSAHKDGTLPQILDDDFVIFGKPYGTATEDEWSIARSITAERHFAFNWLCGMAPGNRWDETPTDT